MSFPALTQSLLHHKHALLKFTLKSVIGTHFTHIMFIIYARWKINISKNSKEIRYFHTKIRKTKNNIERKLENDFQLMETTKNPRRKTKNKKIRKEC